MSNIRALRGRAHGEIPTLTTDRLQLRPHTMDDLDVLIKLWADETFVRFIGRRPRTEPEVWKTVQSMIGSWALLGYGYWVIETRPAGEFVGEIGFLEGLRPVSPAHTGTPEAGWGLSPDHWGKGYATEALEAALRWSDEIFPDKRSVCMIEEDHHASIRVAEKCGYTFAYSTSLDGGPIHIFERIGT
ncbi:MAG: GNAT family N-acetyltransferase [Pseudomonadota bacterium]